MNMHASTCILDSFIDIFDIKYLRTHTRVELKLIKVCVKTRTFTLKMNLN